MGQQAKIKEVKKDRTRELESQIEALKQELTEHAQQNQALAANFQHYNDVVRVLKEKLGDKDVTIASHEITIAQLKQQIEALQDEENEQASE